MAQSEASTSHTPRPASPMLSDDDEQGFGLDDLLPLPESPVPPPYSFSTYIPPVIGGLPMLDSRTQLILRLVGSHPLWGHHLWNTARTLTDYLLENPALVRGRTTLELGAGAALPSIVALLAGADKAVMTDYPDAQLVDNMQYNVDVNLGPGLAEHADVEGFLWGRDPGPLLAKTGGEGYDLLILSDLVFNHSQHPALISSVNSLLRHAPSSSTFSTTSSTAGAQPFTSTPPPSSSPSPSLSPSPSPSHSPSSHPRGPSQFAATAAPEAPPPPPPPPPDHPSILVFITHHRPHLVAADLNFFPALAASSAHAPGGWAYQRVLERFAGAMFDHDPGDAQVRGTVYGWRCWRVRRELGEQPGEVLGQV